MRLTDLSIKKLLPPEAGQKTYYDDVLTGFGVRISQGGAKSFIVMYGPKRRLKTIGRFPEMKLADARVAAKQLLGRAAALGEEEETPKRASVSFSAARDLFLEASARRNKSSTAAEYQRLLFKHFSFEKPIDQLTRDNLMKAIAKLADAPSEQDHAFVALRTMMNWCAKQGLIEVSPMPPHSVRKTARERVLDTDEIVSLLKLTETYPYPYGSIVRLLLLTGQRRGEITALRWKWINRDKRTITLPKEITKNNREHTFPYGELVEEVFDSLPELGDNLFPSRSSKGDVFSGWSKAKVAFDKKLPEVEAFTLHDLRRTFASTLASLGTPIHVTEKLLNHVSGTISGIAAVYNRHSYFEEMKEAVGAYDRYLKALIQEASQ
jgi:integrase